MSETLQNLLAKLNAADNALVELTDEEQSQIIVDLAKKIDSYVYVLDHYDERIRTLEINAELIHFSIKQLRDGRDNLKEQMKLHMESQGFDKLTGDIHQVSLVKRKDVELTLPEETDDRVFMIYPEEFSSMKKVWSWNKNKIKEAIKNYPEHWGMLGTPVIKTSLRFGIRK